MSFSGYPTVACANCSATHPIPSCHNNFEETCYAAGYLADADNMWSDCSLPIFFDDSATSLDLASEFLPNIPSSFNPPLPGTTISLSNRVATANSASQQYHGLAPVELLDQTPSRLSINSSIESTRIPPDADCSSSPSLYSDTTEASVSPHTLKRPSLSPSIGCREERTTKRSLRKRGRPRLDCSDKDDVRSALPVKHFKQCRNRVPHNQVERKYREGLNSEIEKLRRAVPTLPQSSEGGVIGQPKPSKAVVLAAAVDYIKRTEKERDTLREEIERSKHIREK